MTKKMTAQEARTFSTYSDENAAFVEESFDCSCQAYTDIFTYNRWKAQGMQVQKGQKAAKIKTYIPIMKEDDNGDEFVAYMKSRITSVFCRCQVKGS
jgi:hypothetical protein